MQAADGLGEVPQRVGALVAVLGGVGLGADAERVDDDDEGAAGVAVVRTGRHRPRC